MTAILCGIFFLSGAAALIFETLWFRQTGLVFGNSVWASSIVLSSFMGGLALGNYWMARWGYRIRRPLRLYAALECVIAVVGVALVVLLPLLAGWLAPLLRPLQGVPVLLNTVRLSLAFVLLLVPATAMGATLPIFVKALLRRDPHYGSVLGKLYGWNTLGAVLGAAAGEALLVGWLGVSGTALIAASLDLTAAAVAVLVARGFMPAEREAERPAALPGFNTAARRLCLAAFGAGGILLALEVVWFRFLHLFVHPGSLAFALMLSTVLAGIGIGGFAGGLLLRRDEHADRHAAFLACICGVLTVAVYMLFAVAVKPYPELVHDAPSILWLAACLTLPNSIASGVLFTLLGSALNRQLREGTRATGFLTLANTVGAGLGAFVAGFVLLPWLGMERSFFAFSFAYAGVALLAATRLEPAEGWPRQLRWAGVAALGIMLVFFPFGAMQSRYIPIPVRRAAPEGDVTRVAFEEGRIETIVYLRRDYLGEPLSYHLLTDGFRMSATMISARRYMKLYVYLPVALRPEPTSALLISYGVGMTAKALTDTGSLERIDIVDISREILQMSDLVFVDEADHPLKDPRVEVHIEDGRQFLQTTDRRFDIITGEPPPPKAAGVVNLYTREYFRLVYDRLTEGGINTYWLPIHGLTRLDARSIVCAYCEVFENCSLWVGARTNWMLVGSRGDDWPQSELGFRAQWDQPAVHAELEAVGFDAPEALGALFLGDAEDLREFIAGAPPLTDNFPKRISNEIAKRGDVRFFQDWLDSERAKERFKTSEFIRTAWPPSLREKSERYFDFGQTINEVFGALPARNVAAVYMQSLHDLLTGSSLRSVALWRLGTTHDELAIVHSRLREGDSPEQHALPLAAEAMVKDDYDEAARLYEIAWRSNARSWFVFSQQIYALCMAGRREDAEKVVAEMEFVSPLGGVRPSYWKWMEETFGLPRPDR